MKCFRTTRQALFNSSILWYNYQFFVSQIVNVASDNLTNLIVIPTYCMHGLHYNFPFLLCVDGWKRDTIRPFYFIFSWFLIFFSEWVCLYFRMSMFSVTKYWLISLNQSRRICTWMLQHSAAIRKKTFMPIHKNNPVILKCRLLFNWSSELINIIFYSISILLKSYIYNMSRFPID